MLALFKPKQVRFAYKILENNQFFTNEFRKFKVEETTLSLLQKNLLEFLPEVIRSVKLDHSRLLKAILLILRILQIAPKMQENTQIEALLDYLENKIISILFLPPEQGVQSAKITGDSSAQGFNGSIDLSQNIYFSPANHLTGKIAKPLIDLQKRILHCYQMAYRPRGQIDFSLCWATLNLLRRFTDFGKNLQEIGRYYVDQYIYQIIEVIKVLHNDIKILYKRSREYLTREISSLSIKIQQIQMRKLPVQLKQELRQILLLVQQIEGVNQNIRIIYCSKYYTKRLVLNQIIMPSLFSNQHQIELFYQLAATGKKLNKKNTRFVQSTKDKSTLEQVQNI